MDVGYISNEESVIYKYVKNHNMRLDLHELESHEFYGISEMDVKIAVQRLILKGAIFINPQFKLQVALVQNER